jgi:MFS family permease
MKIPERSIAPAIVALAFAANAFFNHTPLGLRLNAVPGIYEIAFFIGVAVVPSAILLGRIVRREPEAQRRLGFAIGWRDAVAGIAALLIGAALAAGQLTPVLERPGGTAQVFTLFAQLLIASTAEVASDQPFARVRSHAPHLQSCRLAPHPPVAGSRDVRRWLATSRATGMTTRCHWSRIPDGDEASLLAR